MSDLIPLIPEVPQVLRESAQRGTLIPFVGAGASRLAGCPNWSELADKALRCFVDGGKFSYSQLAQVGNLSPRVKLSVALGLQSEHNIQIDFGALLTPIGGYDNPMGRRLFGSLANLSKTFVTTNYDSWLDTEFLEAVGAISSPDQAVAESSTPTRRKTYDDIEDFTPANLNIPNSVFHLHGSLSNPDTMVITTKHYVQRYANDRNKSDDPQKENRTLTFLDYLFSNKTVLFVGYGLDELEILEYIIQKSQMRTDGEQEARHFLLQGFYSHEFELMRSLTRYYKDCDIQLLPFLKDQKDWHQLLEVLENFSQSMQASTLLNVQELREMEALLD
jgi:hypothetical protein